MSAPVHRQITLLTSEHVPLTWTLASWAERVVAFVSDLFLLTLSLIALVLLGLLTTGLSPEVDALLLVVVFLGRNFWFTWSELRGNGQTWGKRRGRLRVIAADGGALEPSMVFARNLTRELECFLPLAAMSTPDNTASALWGLWALAAGLVPLFNRRGQRLGDMIAGTLVVHVPQSILLPDLAKQNDAPRGLAFTPEQLAIYGIKELHVLEDLLRRHAALPQPEALAVVSQRIRAKIAWDPADPTAPLPFLNAFYEAQRKHLEHRMLFGKRRESKTG